MCGIAGFFNRERTWKNDIHLMCDCMKHRGPDGCGYWHDENTGMVLGHRRLSILDLSDAGSQPMVSQGGRYVIVLNGEIYNFEELKGKLSGEKKVTGFRGHSDTEILLEYIAAYGLKTSLDSIIGMYAFALYDREEKKLFLGRDRMGEKPLYYGNTEGSFLFSSELSAIHSVAGKSLEIDRDALAMFFKYGYIPAPYTIYKGICKLDSGTVAEFDCFGHCIEKTKYWDLREIAKMGFQRPFDGTEEEAAEELERLLTNSIKMQMVADVPVGAFLSGGIDSTTVVALMQKHSQNKIKTFSIGFNDAHYNEASFAKKTAEYLGTDHTELYISEDDAISVINMLPQIYSEPFADSSQIPTYMVSKLARNQVTVSLSGDGGDELFGGYTHYYSMPFLWNKVNSIPKPLRRLGASCIKHMPCKAYSMLHYKGKALAASTPEQLYDANMDVLKKIVPEGTVPRCWADKYLFHPTPDDLQQNLMVMDSVLYLPDDILVKVDRSAMACSLESRVPLLDKNIVEFAWTLPKEYKLDANCSKKVLRNVLYKYVPKESMERPKQGFSMPVNKWLNGKLGPWMEEMLNPAKINNEGLLDVSVVSELLDGFKKNGFGEERIWYLLIFETWLEAVKRTTFKGGNGNGR